MIWEILCVLFAAVLGYCIGSINFALVISKLGYKKDIREYGSKNAGMTNMLRTFGKFPAFLTLLGDFGKGIAAILIGRLLFAWVFGPGNFPFGDAIVGLCALLGHVFPLYYGFKGGKGILVTAGVMLAIDWMVFFIVLGVFLLFFICTRIISVGSLAATVAYPIATCLKTWLIGDSFETVMIHTILAVLMAALIVYMHRGNIQRLIRRQEPKVGK